MPLDVNLFTTESASSLLYIPAKTLNLSLSLNIKALYSLLILLNITLAFSLLEKYPHWTITKEETTLLLLVIVELSSVLLSTSSLLIFLFSLICCFSLASIKFSFASFAGKK